jgi:molybdopterin/thiamine biosynthesis adenylyltransferase
MSRARTRILLVGLGGLGCAAAFALARAGVGLLGLADDDTVERGNLHRQILYGDRDVGRSKVDAAAGALRAIPEAPDLRLHRERLLPNNALSLVGQYDIVLEGSDNFATKFLAADACALAQVAVVHASAVRWVGTALAVGARAKPCYRCLFEDLPAEQTANCASAGVMGPVVGMVAAVQVDLALSIADGAPTGGTLVTFDGRSDAMRRRRVSARPGCALCGEGPRIRAIETRTYTSAVIAG